MPRRLRVGSADASSRGWTMIVSELANFFVETGGSEHGPRLARLARELHCPAFAVDVRDSGATTLCEADPHGRLRVSGAPGHPAIAHAAASDRVGFALIDVGDHADRIAAVDRARPMALADLLGALAGFPSWTRHGDDAIAAGELFYEPPPIPPRAHGLAYTLAGITMQLETREANARRTARVALPAHDRRGRRPRSASRPRR